MAKQKKRDVVEMMFVGADRASLVTERIKKLYEGGRSGQKEGQSETASPEGRAAESLQEEISRAPQEGAHAVRQMSRITERVRKVREIQERGRWYSTQRGLGESGSGMSDQTSTCCVPSVRIARTSKTLLAGEQMRASALKKAEQAAKKISVTDAGTTIGNAGKSTVKATKRVVSRAKEAVVNSAKAVYHGIKSSAALIAAGGGVAVFVILMICMVGMIFGSAFGIFFSGSQSSSSQRTIRTVMLELDAGYDQQVAGIQGSTEYDLLELHGRRPEWKEVMAVYAVKTNLDPNDSDELITMTKKKEKKLRDVYWDMVQISSTVETEKRTVTTSVTDESGNVTEKTEEKKVTVLTIRTISRSAREMAVEYGFGLEQEELLKELLDSNNDPLWEGIIY